MELTPQALHDVEFREARRGGYHTRDVDDFLERVAVGVGQLQDRLREAYHRAEAAESRLADMQRQLDEVQRRGPEGPSDTDETLRRTLVLAQRTADATIKEAKDEANQVLAEARDEASRIRAAAESDARREAKVEVEQLAGTRDALLRDIEMVEGHLEEQRNRVRDGIESMQRLLDDPSGLRTEAAPPVTEVKPLTDLPGNLPGSAPAASNGGGAPGVAEPADPGRPANDGSMVAALQELPRREPKVDPTPPTEPMGFPPASATGTTGFLPDLRSAFEPPEPPGGSSENRANPMDKPLDDLSLPIDAPPPPPPPPGLEHLQDVGGIPIEPGSRPSEWGRGVFDTDDEASEDIPRFGRRH
jgi:DivIVA domain-containing protein